MITIASLVPKSATERGLPNELAPINSEVIEFAESGHIAGTLVKSGQHTDAEALYAPKHTSWIPDWRDPSSYNLDGDETELSKWAWEFLRRNPKFQQHCDKKELDDANMDGPYEEWSPCWGLAEFKHYRHASDIALGRKGRPPQWGITEPLRIIKRTKDVRGREFSQNSSLIIERGQVAALFDLNDDLLTPGLLKMQIDSLRDTLEAALSNQRKGKKNATSDAKPWKSKLLIYLRVFDALTGPKPASRAEIGRKLVEERLVFVSPTAFGSTNQEYGKAIQAHIAKGKELVEEGGYLRLLVPSNK